MNSVVSSQSILVAAFNNDHLGLCANVRELSESQEFEVVVVDAFSGDIVVSRNFNSKADAVKTAEMLVDIRLPKSGA
jgi:hypothetical protein